MNTTPSASYQLLCDLNLIEQIECCATSFFSNIGNIELRSKSFQADSCPASRTITAVINFEGAEQGFVALNCSEALARRLTACMMGECDEPADENLDNAMGEAVNILAGNLIENTRSKNRYKLSVPAVIHGDDTLLQQLLTDTRGYTCSFSHETEHIHVKLVITSMNCMAEHQHSSNAATALSNCHLVLVCPCCGYSGTVVGKAASPQYLQ